MTFAPFDPLEFKTAAVSEAALAAVKREIGNILSSYVGWYDPFCELIQNALDAIDARKQLENAAGNQNYSGEIDIFINLDENSLTISDNGIGLDEPKFQQFLAPNFSFKSGNTRGHKGVGATYLAYGFNYMRIATKYPGYIASGIISNARGWVGDFGAAANPKVEPDTSGAETDTFNAMDRGVSIKIRFDDNTHPKRLDWIGATTAQQWSKILRIKTGLGAPKFNDDVQVQIRVKHLTQTTEEILAGTEYLWLHTLASKTARVSEIEKAQREIFEKFGPDRKLPDRFNNLDFVYDSWDADDILAMLGENVDEETLDILAKHTPKISVEFGYTANLWKKFNDDLKIRANYRVLSGGIQLAANNMPQGEIITIPLNRNIGRQNQIHFLFHFDNYTPDMGRKGFHRELTDFAKNVSRYLTENVLSRLRTLLKANTGAAPDLARELRIADWKKEMLSHETENPMHLQSPHFFKPVERVSITSSPSREQDVIALFHQLVAGGIIRGFNVLATSERFTYDGSFKLAFDLPIDVYVYDADENPLGMPKDAVQPLMGRITDPMVLEYKYSLDGLIEDLENQDKNINDIDLCVCWSSGEMYKERFSITSVLIPENSDQRQYHGVTHVLNDIETGGKHCYLMILEDMIDFLNDPIGAGDRQRHKYE
jgi:hypothetical protein